MNTLFFLFVAKLMLLFLCTVAFQFPIFLPFVPCLNLRTWNLRLSAWRQRAGRCTVFGGCSLLSHVFSASSCVSILQPTLFVPGSPGSKPGSSGAQVKGRPVVSLHKRAGNTHRYTCKVEGESEWKLKLKPHDTLQHIYLPCRSRHVGDTLRFGMWTQVTTQHERSAGASFSLAFLTHRNLLWLIHFTLCHYHLYLKFILSGLLQFPWNTQRFAWWWPQRSH